MQTTDPRRPHRQDTFDLRDQISPESTHMQMQAHADAAAGHYEVYGGADDEEGYSIMEHDSDGEEQDEGMYEDDLSSELSIPDESINFDLVYSLHSFAATVEGQANVVKGDSLILMDDSNSYWWLVKVLKTQEVGYIPAENIETPFERLARLNKHRNVDLASATELEKTDSDQDYSRLNAGSRSGNRRTPSPRLAKSKSVLFNASFPVHRYLPAVWNEEDEDEDDNMEWDDVAYIGEDPGLADEERERELAAMEALSSSRTPDTSMEDPSQWGTDLTIEEMQAQARARQQQQQQQLLLQQQQPQSSQRVQLPNALMPGGGFGQQQQQPPQQNQHETLAEQQVEQQQQVMEARTASGTTTERPTPQPTSGLYISAMEKERERQQQEDAALRAKRRAEEEATAAEEARKRSKPTPSSQGAGVINPVSSPSPNPSPSKLRKDPKGDRDRDADSEDSNGGKKKKGSVFRGLFGRKDKDKDKEKEKDRDKSRAGSERGTSIGSIGSQGSLLSLESSERDTAGRISEESRPGQQMPPQPSQQLLQQRQQLQLQQQQQQLQQTQQPQLQPQPQPQQPEAQGQQQQQFSTQERPTASSSALSSLSPHASQLRQKDMQQQALYQQYLNRSPSSPPEAQPSYGLQSESALMSSSAFRGGAVPGAPAAGARAASPAMNPSVSGSSNLSNVSTTTTSTSSSSVPSAGSSISTSMSHNTNNTALGLPPSTPRQRPGSLIFNTDGQGPGVPDLSVIRVFAGRNLQTDATFKTVLLNASTTAAELVKQAIQRFRLPPSEGLGSSDPYASTNFDSSTGVGAGNVPEGWANEYYLTVKRVEGGVFAILRPTERPLVVFESLVLQALQEAADAAEEEGDEDENGFSNLPPRVKRSSVGSISSVASNLSMHSAIRRLPMNDFTDDSAVKFYLNRRTSEREREKKDGAGVGGGYVSVLGGGAVTMDGEGSDRGGGSQYGLYGDEDEVEDHTIVAEASLDELSFSLGEGDVSATSTSSSLGNEISSTIGQGLRYLSGLGPSSNVPPERFSSPSLRFALQLVIHPSDLPDDMVFHPYTEAIVPRDTLPSSSGRDGGGVASSSAPFRRKVFMFPKNVTVAEVIELGLERFGILEGVVDGGDEVEDKFTKRRSTSRVRYGLCVDVGTGQERELVPMSKVTDAFPRPPTYRTQVPNFKRRSVDSTNLLGNIEDVSPDDPVFILRRATAYRNSTSRHRMSAPLDEIALQQLHHQRDSTASSTGSEGEDKSSKGPPSRQEIIAQRAATRTNQRAIVSAQSNSVRGMDVLLPNNTVIRSGRFDSSDRLRYSYVEPDGETYDISDIVAEEWREHNRQDVLAGVVGKNRSAVDSEKLDRVLDKIRSGKIKEREREKRALGVTAHGGGAGGSADMRSIMSLAAVDSLRSTSPSEYSLDDRATAAQALRGDGHSRTGSASSYIGDGRMLGITGRPGTTTPTGNPSSTINISGSSTPTGKLNTNVSKRNPSIAAVLSESPTNMDTPTMSTSPLPKPSSQSSASSSSSSRHGQTSSSSRSKSSMSSQGSTRRPIIPKDEFGIDHMMAVIECKAALQPDSPTSSETQPLQSSFAKSSTLQPLDPVDAILFGRPMDVESLHPLVRDVYAGAFKQLEEMDNLLDEFMGFNSIRVS